MLAARAIAPAPRIATRPSGAVALAASVAKEPSGASPTDVGWLGRHRWRHPALLRTFPENQKPRGRPIPRAGTDRVPPVLRSMASPIRPQYGTDARKQLRRFEPVRGRAVSHLHRDTPGHRTMSPGRRPRRSPSANTLTRERCGDPWTGDGCGHARGRFLRETTLPGARREPPGRQMTGWSGAARGRGSLDRHWVGANLCSTPPDGESQTIRRPVGLRSIVTSAA